MKMFIYMIMSIEQQIINRNGKIQTNRDQKYKFLFLQQHDQSRKF